MVLRYWGALLEALVLSIAVGLLTLALVVQNELHSPLPILIPETFVVHKGQSITKSINVLAEKKWITYPRFAQWYWRYQIKTPLKAGDYLIKPGMTLSDLFSTWSKGEVIRYQITFLEGWRFEDIKKAILENEMLKHTINNWDSRNVMQLLDRDEVSPEGLFFPSTYHFDSETTDLKILKTALIKMDETLAQSWRTRSESLPYQSAYEALIMASIIEKETSTAEEYPLVASVFVNRLSKKMRLQTDPTVIYGMGEGYQGNITKKDLQTPTPFNTYVIDGLPPTPIAMPGKSAIEAALNPSVTDNLYFVATGRGGHRFSKTLMEHNQAVRSYLNVKRQDNQDKSNPSTSNKP